MPNSTSPRKKQQVASQFNRAAHTYDEAARIQHFSALELAQQLQRIQDANHSQMPHSVIRASVIPNAVITGTWLDLGCGTGFAVPTLTRQGAQQIIGADLAHSMCLASKEKLAEYPFQAITCDAENLPFAKHSFDGIYSNLMIQWSEQLNDLFYETQRVLKPGGLFAFATLGPRTMFELKRAWQQVDPFTHVNQFDDKADLVSRCEEYFDIESLQQQEVVQHHPSLRSLLKELKAIGATNVNSGRRPGLGGRERLRKLEQAYRQQSISDNETGHNEGDYLPLTYDLIWIIARNRSS
jgi:malonyl-CoA O-methyltransferase